MWSVQRRGVCMGRWVCPTQGLWPTVRGCGSSPFVKKMAASPWPKFSLQSVTLADPRGGARDVHPPGSKFFHFHAVFNKKLKIIGILGVGAPPWGKSWIRYWVRTIFFVHFRLTMFNCLLILSILSIIYRIIMICRNLSTTI